MRVAASVAARSRARCRCARPASRSRANRRPARRGAPGQPAHPRDELGLLRVDRKLRAARRCEPDEVEVLGADRQRQPGRPQRHAVAATRIRPASRNGSATRKPVAQRIVSNSPLDAVDEVHAAPVEPLDPRRDADPAVLDPVRQQVVDDRRLLVQVARRRRRQAAVRARRADHDVGRARARSRSLSAHRQPRRASGAPRAAGRTRPWAGTSGRAASRSSTRAARSATSTARSQPELPAPTVSTRVPSMSSMSGSEPEWICLPVNAPGYDGTFGSRRWPLQTTTPA